MTLKSHSCPVGGERVAWTATLAPLSKLHMFPWVIEVHLLDKPSVDNGTVLIASTTQLTLHSLQQNANLTVFDPFFKLIFAESSPPQIRSLANWIRFHRSS